MELHVLVHERAYRDSFTAGGGGDPRGFRDTFHPDVVRALDELSPAGWAVG